MTNLSPLAPNLGPDAKKSLKNPISVDEGDEGSSAPARPGRASLVAGGTSGRRRGQGRPCVQEATRREELSVHQGGPARAQRQRREAGRGRGRPPRPSRAGTTAGPAGGAGPRPPPGAHPPPGPRRLSWPPAVRGGGILLSLAANRARAQPTAWGRIVAAVPPAAFLVAVSMIERRAARRPRPVAARDGEAPAPGRPSPVRDAGDE